MKINEVLRLAGMIDPNKRHLNESAEEKAMDLLSDLYDDFSQCHSAIMSVNAKKVMQDAGLDNDFEELKRLVKSAADKFQRIHDSLDD
jgi:hypothetical protein